MIIFRPAPFPPPFTPGPDGRVPIEHINFAQNTYWYGGRSFKSFSRFMDFAGGSFSRGSDATYFDASGILRTAGPNVLRLDHNPITGKALGARLEGARTNVALRSSDFLNSWWTKTQCSVTANQGVAPDGSSGMHRLTADGNFPRLSRSAAAGDNEVWCASVFVSPDTATKCTIVIIDKSGNQITVLFDLIALTAAHVDGTTAGYGIEPLQNGVSRIWMSASVGSGPSVPQFRVVSHANGYPGGWAGSNSLIAWGAQIELAAYPSSYLPTNASAVSRLADSLTFARAAPAEGTLVIEGRTAAGKGSSTQVLWVWDAGSGQNRMFVQRSAGGQLSLYLIVGGATAAAINLGAVDDNADFKIAFSFSDGLLAASRDGAAPVTVVPSAPIPAFSTMRVGRQTGVGVEWFGTIARLGIFDKAYSPADLPAMSAI